MTLLHQIRDQVRSRLGIALGAHKDALLSSRLERLRVQEGYHNLETFQQDLEAGDPRAVEALARHLTTNHTYFFREPEQFEFLVDRLRSQGIARPRIWSAAGSTGEEGYSLAMVLAEAGYRDFLVLVSDVNPEVLARAHRGVFDSSRMARVPPDWSRRYFEPRGNGYVALQELRSHLRFRRLNLMEPLEPGDPVDAIFCRNLLIYFDPEGVTEVLGRLGSLLPPGGLLFLGQTEGFHRPPAPMVRVGPAIYQKRPIS